MDPVEIATIIDTIAKVINEAVVLGPTVIKAVDDAKPFAQLIYGLFTGTNVTQAQVDDLLSKLDALSDQLDVDLPPDDGTTTT